jgi:hypothetical protein
MERRKAITAAAAASLTLLAGAGGIALNSGIVGAGGDGKVGKLSPVTATSAPATVYVDEPTSSTAATPAPTVRPTETTPVATSAPSAYEDDHGDDHGDDHLDEHDGDHDDDHDHDHEYEGAEDDD